MSEGGRQIVMISYDFRRNGAADRGALEWKIARDGWRRTDSFFMIVWGTRRESVRLSDRIHVETFKAFAGPLRPLYDLISLFVAPYIAWRRGVRPDLIVIGDLPLALGAATIRMLLGGKVLVRLVGLPRELAHTRGFLHVAYTATLETLCKRLPDLYLVINEATRRYIEDLGVPAKRIRVIPADSIGIDGDLIESVPQGAARKELGIPAGAPLILSVGRLEPEKAFDELIRVFLDSKAEGTLVILGEGILRPKLEGLIASRSASGKVILAGQKSRRDLWAYLKDADAYALISLTEGIGLSFWEAIMVDVPVIGRPVGGVKETIGEDGLRGFFWKTGDGEKAFAERLLRCIRKDAGVREMMARAKTFVGERISEARAGVAPLV